MNVRLFRVTPSQWSMAQCTSAESKKREREINEFKPKNKIKNETLPSPALRWCSQLPKIIAVKIAADNRSQMWNLWNVLKCITGSNEHNSCITVTDKSEICLSGGTTAQRCWWRIYKVSAAVSLSVCWPMHWFERQQKLMEIKKKETRERNRIINNNNNNNKKGNEVIQSLRKERRSSLCKCRAQGGTQMNRGCYAG